MQALGYNSGLNIELGLLASQYITSILAQSVGRLDYKYISIVLIVSAGNIVQGLISLGRRRISANSYLVVIACISALSLLVGLG